MSDFKVSKNWKVYLDQETQDELREIMPHLEEHYDGISDFVQQKIHEEQPLSIEQQIEQAEEEKDDVEERLKRLRSIKREQESREKLESLRSELRSKQDKLREAQESSSMSEADALYAACQRELEYKRAQFTKVEWLEKKADRVSRKAEKLMGDGRDVGSLKREVEELQEQVAELNGGREDWFISLDSEAVEA
jgi:chromosome segregation ATPase